MRKVANIERARHSFTSFISGSNNFRMTLFLIARATVFIKTKRARSQGRGAGRRVKCSGKCHFALVCVFKFLNSGRRAATRFILYYNIVPRYLLGISANWKKGWISLERCSYFFVAYRRICCQMVDVNFSRLWENKWNLVEFVFSFR